MTINYVAFLHKNGVPIEKHIINMPAYGEKGWYISVCSIGAFKNREASRFYDATYVKPKKLPVHCSVWMMNEWEYDTQLSSESIERITGKPYVHPYNLLPTFSHNGVFEFYKAVGYEYKKKRYI